MTSLPDWADTVAGFVETFGKGVKVTNLRLASVPGFQLGVSVAEGVARVGGYLEAYEHDMPGFGPLIDADAKALPTGWKRRGDVTQDVARGTVSHTIQSNFRG